MGSQEGRTVDEMGEEGSKGGLTVESFAVFTPPCLALPCLSFSFVVFGKGMPDNDIGAGTH